MRDQDAGETKDTHTRTAQDRRRQPAREFFHIRDGEEYREFERFCRANGFDIRYWVDAEGCSFPALGPYILMTQDGYTVDIPQGMCYELTREEFQIAQRLSA